MDRVDREESLKEIIRTIQPRGFARKLLRKIKIKGASATLSKSENSIAAYVPESGEIPVRIPSHLTKILVVPYKIALRSILTNEIIEDSGIDIIKEELLELSNAIERKEDKDFFNCLLICAAKTILHESYNSTPEMSPDSFGGGVDPFDREFIHSVVRERPILDDIVAAMKHIEQNGGTPDYIVVNPVEAEDLRRRDELKEARKTFGLKVIITDLIDEHFALVFDSKNAAVFVERRPPAVSFTKDYEEDGVEISVTERISIVCLNGNMVVRLQRSV